MFKKLLTVVTLITGFSLASKAQDYTVFANPVDSTTTGTPVKTPDMEGYPYIELVNHVTNITSNSLSITWKIISVEIPPDWKLVGICDNVNCFGDDNTLNGLQHTTNPIAAGANGLFDARVYAPISGTVGTGTFKVRLSTLSQADTVVFRVNKTATGITTISMEDNRVSVYPNPAVGGAVKIFTSKELNASAISISNIAGQTVSTLKVAKGSELTDVNISELANGSYMINVSDDKGHLVTSRRLVIKK